MRKRSDDVREFILANVHSHPSDIAALAAREFGISRQAASRHLRTLVARGAIQASGTGRGVHYELKELEARVYEFNLKTSLAEDKVWAAYVRPVIAPYAGSNSNEILNYGFTEIFNNALDHSEGNNVVVSVLVYPRTITLEIIDDGMGIFKKIQDHFGLDDPRHALLELAKGKVTSDPARHTGEGIFFASRMFDGFYLSSHFLTYVRHGDADWLFENRDTECNGTYVAMEPPKHNE
jgi:DNA-binding transcriptional ArsR family regulator